MPNRRPIVAALLITAFVAYVENASARYIQPDPIGLDGDPNVYAYANNAPTMYIDPDGRKVVIVGHLAAGFMGRATNPNSYHLAIHLDPDDKCQCQGNWPMTLGAQPDFRINGTTWLVRSINNPGDAASQATFTQVVMPPSGVSDCEFIKRLIAAASAYRNNQRYSFPSIVPGIGGRDGQMGPGEYNSNSFVSGTFNGAGFPIPTINGLGFQTPGYSNPVPIK